MDDPAGIADGDGTVGNVFGDDRSCTDGYIVTDMYAWKDGDAASDPDTVSDGDRLRPFTAAVAFCRVRAVAGRIDAYVRPNETVVAAKNRFPTRICFP